ncbi:MAG: hypothetical protein O2931_04600 [Planctomycetota bacterium]|nr:hypothetical protein [Planctomycetota bacterium]MDA1178060.1 hypothetical protein [Planctomycetota bacterium]
MMTTTPYEALVESAARLTDIDTLARIDASHASTASELLIQNEGALESARRVLGPTCVVSLRYEEAFFAKHCDHLLHLRNLARAFRAEARLAASRNDLRTAARINIDILELANAVRRGGLVVSLNVGIGFSGIAMDILRKIRTKIDHSARRLVIDELHRLEAERESFVDVVARDRDWEIAVGYEDKTFDFMSLKMDDPEECGVSEEEQMAVRQLLQQMSDLPKSDFRKMQSDGDCHILALMRLLAVDLAIRECHATSGSIPNRLSSLTPQPFAELPHDPFTEKSFIYRRINATSFDLYSTGPKLLDGGGHFGPWWDVAAGCADLCLDADNYTQA